MLIVCVFICHLTSISAFQIIHALDVNVAHTRTHTRTWGQVDKGWMFKDVLKFVMQQPEVLKGYKDGKYYLPSKFLDDDEL